MNVKQYEISNECVVEKLDVKQKETWAQNEQRKGSGWREEGGEGGKRARFKEGYISQLFVYFTILLFSRRSLQGGKEAVGAWELKKRRRRGVKARKWFI